MHTTYALESLGRQHRAELVQAAEQHRMGRRARRGRSGGMRPSVAVTHGRRAPRDGLLPAGA